MHVLDVPGEQRVQECVEDHHEDDVEQVVLIVLHWRLGDVVPLHTNALYLVEGEVFGAQTKRCRREYRLKQQDRVIAKRAGSSVRSIEEFAISLLSTMNKKHR